MDARGAYASGRALRPSGVPDDPADPASWLAAVRTVALLGRPESATHWGREPTPLPVGVTVRVLPGEAGDALEVILKSAALLETSWGRPVQISTAAAPPRTPGWTPPDTTLHTMLALAIEWTLTASATSAVTGAQGTTANPRPTRPGHPRSPSASR